ncbi:hypothetical protein F2P79_004909 [Pimephales promelas]|nr:hypothetical protein F2P79_004909 [Pimephales promelas]
MHAHGDVIVGVTGGVVSVLMCTFALFTTCITQTVQPLTLYPRLSVSSPETRPQQSRAPALQINAERDSLKICMDTYKQPTLESTNCAAFDSITVAW